MRVYYIYVTCGWTRPRLGCCGQTELAAAAGRAAGLLSARRGWHAPPASAWAAWVFTELAEQAAAREPQQAGVTQRLAASLATAEAEAEAKRADAAARQGGEAGGGRIGGGGAAARGPWHGGRRRWGSPAGSCKARGGSSGRRRCGTRRAWGCSGATSRPRAPPRPRSGGSGGAAAARRASWRGRGGGAGGGDGAGGGRASARGGAAARGGGIRGAGRGCGGGAGGGGASRVARAARGEGPAARRPRRTAPARRRRPRRGLDEQRSALLAATTDQLRDVGGASPAGGGHGREARDRGSGAARGRARLGARAGGGAGHDGRSGAHGPAAHARAALAEEAARGACEAALRREGAELGRLQETAARGLPSGADKGGWRRRRRRRRRRRDDGDAGQRRRQRARWRQCEFKLPRYNKEFLYESRLPNCGK